MKSLSVQISKRGRQRGSSLVFALMALVVLSLAAVGLVRSVNTGVLIAGNLSFKRDTTLAASAASEQAMNWLKDQLAISPSQLDLDNTAAAYFASAKDGLDITGNSTSAGLPLQVVNWDGSCQGLASSTYSTCDVIPYVGTSVNGNRVQWLITRLCDYDGAWPVNSKGQSNLCTKPANLATGGTFEKGALTGGSRLSSNTATPYYRIVTRVEGPRNTVSYVETIVHF